MNNLAQGVDQAFARNGLRHTRAAKLNPPMAPAFEMPRPQLAERVTAVPGAKLVLVRAPAGFGKTTLMLQLRQRFREAGLLGAWLTVDEADNDLSRFLGFLAAALEQIGIVYRPECEGDIAATAVALLDRIASHEAPFALFVDDFEAIRNPAVLSWLSQIIDNIPPGSRVVLGSRQLPNLGLGRLRAKARMVEIEAAQLRFSMEETRSYLQQRRRLSLTPDQIQRLFRSTEGWATGLWLASMSLEQGGDAEDFIAGFSGATAQIADYLAEDVLARQSEPLRRFLLQTSVLGELTPALCDAVRGAEDSAALLAELEHAGLFLVQMDSGRHRYHALFADFLRGQLRRGAPEDFRQAHRAAAQWYVQEGRMVPAIQHAMQAEDYAQALQWLAREAESLMHERRFGLLVRWLEAVPATALRDYPQLQIVLAWALGFTRGPTEAMKLLKEVESESLDAPLRQGCLAIKPMLLGMLDRVDEVFETMRLNEGQSVAVDRFTRGILTISVANATMMDNRYAEARQYADEARRATTHSAAGFISQQLSEWVEASLDLVQGRLQQALVRLRTAAHLTDAFASGNLLVGVVLAEALYENDQCEAAERLLKVYLPLTRLVALPDQLISAHVVLSRIADARGDQEAALQVLTELEQHGHVMALPRAVACARLERARRYLTQGDIPGAREELARAKDPAVWSMVARYTLLANDVETLELCRLRLQLRSGNAAAVLPELKRGLEAAEQAQRHRRALKYRILYAEALLKDAQPKLAMRMLERALKFAAAEGFIRSFLDEGPTVEAMLRQFFQSREGSSEAAELPPSAHLEKLRRATDRFEALPLNQSALAEPLTPKEHTVLELLAQGHSNEEMAERLFISKTTVCTHLRSINVKLGTGSRMQAVATARRLGLVR